MNIPPPVNPGLDSLPVYVPGKPIEDVARELGLAERDIIKLASNENPLGPSPAALSAMQRVLGSIHLYPDGNAFHLRRRLAEKLGVSPANLLLGNGSNEIIEFVGHGYMAHGVDVVASQYCFLVYPLVTRLFGANLISVPARNHGHDLDAMRAAITPRTSVVFVSNPNNPTGTRLENEALLAFARSLPAHVLLVLDEAYVEFLESPPDFIPLIGRGALANVLVLRTFSKIFGLAGLRIGYGIGHTALVATLEKVRQPFNLNSIAQAGALAALDDIEHIQRTRANNSTGLALFAKLFSELNLEFIPSHANFVLVKTGCGTEICEAMQKLGVIVRPMKAYQLDDWVRITVGTPAENERCARVLRDCVK
jgi:histidinol-phosphate aminotransferase